MHKKEGFSLIEIIVVIALLSVVTVAVVITVNNMNRSAKLKAISTAQQTIMTGMEQFRTRVGRYPNSQTEFENMLLNKYYDTASGTYRVFNIFSGVPQNPYWNDNTNHPEKGWLYDPVLLTVTPVMPSSP